jgi:hypothetical protein
MAIGVFSFGRDAASRGPAVALAGMDLRQSRLYLRLLCA